MTLEQVKDQAVNQERFDEAKQVRDAIQKLKDFGLIIV
jgi:protein-arginine kinase activator protein McsA